MWWLKILSFLTGGFLDKALDAYKARLAAGNDESRIVADTLGREADLMKREAELQAQMVVAEQGNWLTRSIRPLMAAPVVFLIWKLLAWDLALGEWTHGSTDKLSDQTFWLVTTIVVAYMGGRTIEKTASSIANAIRGK